MSWKQLSKRRSNTVEMTGLIAIPIKNDITEIIIKVENGSFLAEYTHMQKWSVVKAKHV